MSSPAPGPQPPAPTPPQALFRLLDDGAERHSSRELLTHAPEDAVTRRLTWAELAAESRQAAARLLGLGVGKGTRVALLCSNRPEWLAIAFAVFRLGAILVPFSTLWKEKELRYGLRHADVETLITLTAFRSHDYMARLRAVVPRLDDAPPGHLRDPQVPYLRRVITLAGDAPGLQRWENLPADTDDSFLEAIAECVSPTDRATIFFTSGTTAQAKAVVHSQRALVAAARSIAERVGIEPGDVWWGHMPLFWSGGFVLGALATLAGGGRILLHESVRPESALSLLAAERCTIMAGWHQAGPLLEQPDFEAGRAPLHKGSFHPLADRLMGAHNDTVGMYGMSETATCVACARWTDPPELRRESAGRPVPGAEIEITDPESGAPLAPGEVGEIRVRSPSLMEGYYGVPREETFDTRGFLRTGDRGQLDETGRLRFLGRLKDVIKTAGVNVAASEIEETLEQDPRVESAHVVGVAHPTRGENVAAFVVPVRGAHLSESDVTDLCRSKLASYKMPRHVFLIEEDALPRTGTGKVEKKRLRSEAERRVGRL